ncbi:MAG TPA: hypothetical protein VK540_33400 [Polyangiaceae bacterium]|nr:hypothetical protein [Polyangiaceae bacterium]
MKARITDKIWVRLAELSPHDVDESTAARIRERALAALSRPGSRVMALARHVERIWTDFVELPVAGAVIVACLIWVFQGIASGRASDHLGRAGFADAIDTERATTPVLRAQRVASRRHRSDGLLFPAASSGREMRR